MKLIGLTGGIGSGKSTVAGMFQTLGIAVYESDHRAKVLMHENENVRSGVQTLFGRDAFLPDGSVNRQWIASKVFNNTNLLKKLNAIVHPAVYHDLLAWAEESEQKAAPYLIQESAILFEENLTDRLDAIILVIADEETRIQRVVDRDKTSAEQVRQRISHQWPDQNKIPLADYVIYNDSGRSLIEQVRDIHHMILEIS